LSTLLFLCGLFLFPTANAQDSPPCDENTCNYTVQLEKSGFYIAVVTLPPGQQAGIWSLVINPKQRGPLYGGGFFAGATLKENASFGSWIGFSLANTEAVQIKPIDYTGINLPLTVKLQHGNNAPIYGPLQMIPGETYTTLPLDPGFYVTSILNQPNAPDTFFGLELLAPSIYGGLMGGWLDSKTGPGYAAFSVSYPQTLTFELMFDDSYGAGGAGQPLLEVYYQNPEGARELVWVADLPKLQPTELPPSYTDTVGDIPISPLFKSSDDGKTSDVERLAVDLYRKQTGKEPVCPSKLAILRGKVGDQTGQSLAGVEIFLKETKGEYLDKILSNDKGEFELAIDTSLFKGKVLPTVAYERDGYLPMDRPAINVRKGYINASDVAMVERGPSQSTNNRSVDLGRGKLLFPQDTAATMTLPDCSVVPVDDFKVQASEYTVDTAKLGTYSMDDPSRQVASNMPFPLPPATGYTYAVELNTDQSVNTKGRTTVRSVDFVKKSAPGEPSKLPLYVDYTQIQTCDADNKNCEETLKSLQPGDTVPMGWYDRQQDSWIPSENGRVVKIVSIDDGLATLDVGNSNLVISDEERKQVGEQYPNHVGKMLWRVPITHFSPWDCNWPFGPPPEAGGSTGEKANPKPGVPDSNKTCPIDGCVIDAQGQVLGETLPVAGTPFSLNYRSSQVPGRKAAYTLDIPLSGEEMPKTLPERVELEVTIAGQSFLKTCPVENGKISCQREGESDSFTFTEDGKTATFTWDGKDALGHILLGKQTANTRVSYVYKGVYKQPATNTAASFGLPANEGNTGTRDGISGDRTRQEISYDKTSTVKLGGWDAKQVAGFGGWTLNIQHVYDDETSTLYGGDGSQRSVKSTPKPSKPPEPEKKPAKEEAEESEEPLVSPLIPPKPDVVDLTNGIRVSYCTPQCEGKGLAVMGCNANCGKLLVGAAHIETDVLQWIGTDSVDKFTIEGQDDTFTFLGNINENTESITDNQWTLQKEETLLLKNPPAMGSATLDFLFAPTSSGSNQATHTFQVHDKYEGIPESRQYGSGTKIVMLTGEGIADNDSEAITPAITLDFQLSVNGQPRSVISNAEADCVSVPGNGEVALTVIPKVNADLVAKRGASPVKYVVVDMCSNDNSEHPFFQRTMTPDSSALSDFFRTVKDEDDKCDSLVVSVGKPVVVKLNQQRDTDQGFIDYTFKVRGHSSDARIRAEGIGSYKTFHLNSLSSNTRSRSNFDLSELLHPYSTTLERARTRSAESCDDGDDKESLKAKLFDGFIASEDGGLLYEFKNSLHIRTLDSLTGQAIYTLKYNPQGYLIEVQDIDGDITRIERGGNNQAIAIVAPYGQRTVLTLDNQGYLAAMANEAGETDTMVYTADGLMTQYKDPRGNVATYEYDKLGLFVKETNPIGGGYSVGRVDQGGGYVATLTSKEGRVSTFQVNGGTRTNTAPDGTTTVITTDEGDTTTRTITSADGTTVETEEKLDTRLASFMASPVPTTTSIKTPNGRTAQITTETVTDPPAYDDNYKPWNLWTLTNKVTVNGRTSTSVFDKTAKTITATSAAGRKSVSILDEKGRVVKEQAPGFVDTSYTYDTRGRLTQVSEGAGVDLRTASLEYDARGNINKVTDALGRQVSFDYDLVGRVTKQTLTDGRQIIYSYDANGNVTTITPPGRPAHGFAYNGEDLQTQYTPPPAGLATPQTQYVYNLDKELTKVVRPDGQSIDFEYDKTKGRLNALNTPNGKYGYVYDDKSGNLTTVTAPDGNSLSYQYDGSLPLSVTWGGAVQGSLSVSYNNDFRVTATSINGGSTVNYDYDADSLLVKAGDLWLVRDPENGMLKGTQLGGKDGIVTQRAYNAFGEMVSETATVNGNSLYTNQYSYDKLGRITQKVETLEGVATTLAYDYDPAGRLVKVIQNGAVTEEYSYDGNGNRLSAVTATHGSVTGSYDEQDRLLQYAGNTYSYTANGELLSKTSNGATTQYQYDVLGNLRSVQLPDGKQLEYVIDASGRRVGKKVNGVLTQGWLYQGSLNPITELDGTGQVVTRFVYGSKANVPDYLVKGDKMYRIVSDHLGSPRLVVDLSTGAVVQRMEYDAFGNVTQDSNPGFQPFGFAGGLYDSETKLVRFGARDYDAEIGRWTAKDPILFAGGDSNLYGYVLNNTVNLIDANGQCPVCVAALVGAAILGGANYWFQIKIKHRTTDPYAGPYYKGDRWNTVRETEPERRFKWGEFWSWTAGGAIIGGAVGTAAAICRTGAGVAAAEAEAVAVAEAKAAAEAAANMPKVPIPGTPPKFPGGGDTYVPGNSGQGYLNQFEPPPPLPIN